MRKLTLEALEDRILYSAEPVATVAAVSEEFINDEFTFEVNFDNAAIGSVGPGDNVGYAPFIDVTVQQGISVNGASYLGTSATLTKVGTWDAVDARWEDGNGNAIAAHPYGGGLDMPTGNADGDTWYRVDLPFGSFTPDQPIATVEFDASLEEAQGAQVAVPLEITAQGGFRFGTDPLNNPLVDPPLQQASPDVFQITPTVLELTKELIAPEGETSTGPNFPRTYVLTIDIADGQTIDDLNVVDLLPNNIVVTGVSVAGGGSYTDNSTLVFGNPSNTNQFDITFDSVTGTSSGSEIVIEFTFYVPEFDANGDPVLDPVTGADSIAFNEAEASGTYLPAVGAPMVVSDSGQPNNEVTLQLEAMTIQKGVTVVDNGTPGGTLGSDYLDYQLQFQVSDYFSVDTLVITDVLSDGQRIVPTTPFQLTLVENGNPLVIDIDPAYIDITILPSGEQEVVIRLSEFLAAQPGLDGTLHGDQYDLDGVGGSTARDAAGQGGTTGSITYRAQIQQNFDTDYPSGDQSVDLNDLLTNAVVMTGRVAGTSNAVEDDSGTETRIAPWASEKTVYAINGDTSPDNLQVAPGDDVTYRIQITLPAADIENLVITDYLPLPVFNVGAQFGGVTSVGAYGGDVPPPGTITFGPNHDLFVLPGPDGEIGGGDDVVITPVVSINGPGNQIEIDFGTFNDIAQTGSYTIELLYTVTATDRPFADNLLLTNQAVISTGTTNNGAQQQTEIQQIVLRQPSLQLTKGVLDSDSPDEIFYGELDGPPLTIGTLPGTFTSEQLTEHPIDADIGGLDAGDSVTFAVTVMNTGGEDAFDIVLTDVPPPGFVIPADPAELELTITRGDGTVLTYSGSALDLFGSGLHIDDLGPNTGALGASGSDGSDVIVVTYKLVAAQTVVPGQLTGNTATLEAFAANEGGYDFTTDVDQSDYVDSASVLFAGLSVTKDLVASDVDDTVGDELTIGEVATYNVTVTLPEGTIPGDGDGVGLVVTDQLPAGYEIVPGSITLVSTGFGGTITLPNGTVLADGATLSSFGDGDTIIIPFGEIVTTADNAAGNNAFTITYQVRVSDTAGLEQGDQLTNTVTVDASTDFWTEESDSHTAEIVTPDIEVEKSVSPLAADAGDTVTYTIVIRNTGDAHSYDTTFLDNFPAQVSGVTITGLTSQVGSGPVTNPAVASYFQVSGNQVTQVGSGFTLAPDEVLTLTVTAVVNNQQTDGMEVVNTASATGTTLEGDHPDEEGEYSDEDDASFTISPPGLTKVVQSSSADHTDGSDLAIGEQVTYYITITVPEASVPLTLTDVIPAGMSYVGSEVISIDPVIENSALAVGDAGTPSGNSVVFDFGTVVNDPEAGNPNDPNTIVVAVTLRVDNLAGNQAGTELTNTAQLDYDGVPGSDITATADVSLVEPDLQVVKLVAPDGDGRDAGDTVTYTIVISHSDSSTADAFELAFRDALPPQLAGVTLGGPNGGMFQIVGGEVVLVGAPDLALGGALQVTVTGTLVDGVTPGQVIGNEAEVTWTSLDDGDPDTSEERGGGGGIDDYSASDDVDITITEVLQIDKALQDPGQATATIGETVGYQLTVDLMEGTTSNLVVTDVLAAGMTYVPNSAEVTLPAGMSGAYVESYDAGTRTLSFTFASIVVQGDNVTGNNSFVITYNAQVQNVAGNQDGTDLQNTATVEADDLDEDSDSVTIELVEPDLAIAKSVSPATPDAGDTVTYTITISHSGSSSADAYDVDFDDLFPAGVDNVTVTGVVASGGATADLSDFALDINDNRHVVTTGDVDIPLGGSVTITITATVINEIAFGETVENTANVTWTSLDDETVTDVSQERGGGGGVNDYTDSDDAEFTVPQATVEKAIVATSATHTGDDEGTDGVTDLTIGETVTYRITVTLPEGSIDQLVISDALPPGMALVNYDLVGALSDSGITFDAPMVVDTAGDPLTFTFNDFHNPVGGSNQLVLEITAVVVNEAGNQAGDVLTNEATVSYTDGDGEAYSHSDSIDVDLVEPDLQVVKTVDQASGQDAGDTVTYTITISHTGDSSADAFDLSFSDEIPAQLTGLSLGGPDDDLFVLSGNSLTLLPGTDLAQGGVYQVTVTGTLVTAVAPGQIIDNTASLTWTSLDGTVAEERDGAGGVDDYAAEDSAEITLDDTFELSKALGAGQAAEATIGEEVDYRLTLTLIEGTTGGVVITDILPEGMDYVSGSLEVRDADGNLLAPTDVVFDDVTRTLTVSFDQIVIAPDGESGNDYITLDYSTVVLNVVGNQSGTTLTNEAEAIALGDLADEAENEPTITVIEPDLQVEKSVSAATGDAGDSLTYTITISHGGSSTADAFDIEFSDELPPQFVGDLVGDVVLGGTDAGLFSYDPVSRQITLVPGTDLAEGTQLQVTVTAVLATSVEPGEIIENTAEIAWSSLDGEVDGERDGSDGDGGLNDYTDSDDAITTVPQITVEKAVVATSAAHTGAGEGAAGLQDVTIGETVTYHITLTVPEGEVGQIVVTDQLALAAGGAALELVSYSIRDDLSSVSYAFADLTQTDSDAVNGNDRLVVTLDDVVSPVGGNRTLVIEVVARVANVAENQSGDTAANSVTVTYTDGEGVAQEFADSVSVDIVEPDLEISKTVGTASGQDAGDSVTYTITIGHSDGSTADAFDLSLTDQLPAGFDPATIVLGGANANLFTANTVTGEITLNAGVDLPQSSVIVVTVTATLTDAVEPGEVIANTATLEWTSLPGEDANERDGDGGVDDYGDSDSVDITLDSVFDLEKSLADGQAATVAVGEQVDYELTLSLIEGTTRDVEILDQLPEGLAYVSGSLTVSIPGVGTVSPVSVDFDADTGLLTVDLGDVVIPAGAGADQIVLNYQALVLNVAGNQGASGADPATLLTNNASASGLDADGSTLSDDEETVTVEVVEPQLEVSKAVTPATGADAGDTVTYTITIQHGADSTADAFDIVLSDLLPAAFVPGSEATDFVVTGAAAGSFSLVGQQVSSNGEVDLAMGGEIVITITGTLAQSVEPGELVENDVEIAWSSLDDQGDEPTDEERDGGGGIDDYNDSDDADLTVATVFDLVKTLAAGEPSDVMIGDVVSYELTLTLIEGTTNGVVISDTVPAGLSLDGGSIAVYNGDTLLTAGTDYTLLTVPGGFTVTMIGGTVIEADNDTTNNFLRVTYDVTVQDVVGNTAGTVLTNTAQAEGEDADGGELGDEEEVSVTIIEPMVAIEKTVESATGYDAGDTVTYTVELAASGGTTAYDLVFTDVLGPEFSGAVEDVTISGPDAALFSYDESTRTISIVPGTDLPDGATLQFTVQVVLVDTVEPNQVINNAATIEWTSLDGDVPGERSDEASDDVDITVDGTFELTKAFADGQAASATIGEQVNYQLTLQLIEGVTEDVVVTDDLPEGMDFVGTEVMVSIAGGAPFAVAVTAPGPGGQLVIDLGDVTIPADNDPANNLVVITYTTVVLNEVGNQAGDLLQNEASATGQDANGENLADEAEDEPELRLVEPSLDIVKTVSPMAGNAGDPVTYTITISNPVATDGADAFDLVLSDLLPPGFTPGSEPSDFTVSGADPAAFTLVGNQLSSDGQIDLAMGAADIVITITGTLNDTVQPGEMVVNEATLTWSSLDDQGTAPTDHERDGADGVGGELDDYAEISTASLLVDTVFEVEKSLADGAQTGTATIGEVVDYEITLTLIEGTTHSVVVTDQLPAGLAYDGNGVSLTIAGVTTQVPSGSITYDSGSGLLTIDLGDVTIPGDNVAGNDTAVLAFSAVVQNVAGNQDGTTLTNGAAATAEDGGGGELGDESDEDPTVTVVEPDLEVIKEVTPASGLDAGDVVTYTITIQHTGDSTADAYDIDFSDVFPPGVNVTAVVVGGTGGATAANFAIDLANDTISSNAGLHLAQGQTIVLTVTATLENSVGQNETIVNDATITWSSLEGDVEGERDGSGGEAGDPDDFHDEDDAELVTTEVFDLVKSLADGQAATATIGETVNYQLTLTLPEGTTDAVVITDQLPAGLAYDGLGVAVTIPGVGSVTPASVNYDSGTGLLTIDLGDVVIPGDNDGSNNVVTLTYGAVVQNVTGNQDGTELTNSASATGEDANGGELGDDDESTTVTVVEPDLEVIKEVTPASGLDAGDVVTYTITIQHTGDSTADAYDIDFSDVFPPGVNVTAVVVGGTGGATAANFAIDLANDTISSNAGLHLAQGETIVLTVTATLENSVGQNETIVNDATITWSSLQGDVEGERDGSGGEAGDPDDYHDEDDAELVTTEVFDLVKSLADGQPSTVTIGSTVNYQLTLTLIEGTTYGVVVTDDLPDGMALVGDSVMVSLYGGTPMAVAVTPPAPGGTLTIDLGDVLLNGNNNPADNSVIITYSAVVLDVAENERGDELTNAADATADDANGDELSDGDEPDDETTVTIAEPDLDIVKTVDDATPEPGQTITYTVTVSHNAASDADAMDVLIGDLIDNANLTLVPGSVQLSGSAAGSATVLSGNGDGDTAIQVGLATLAQGDTVTITYQVTVAADATIIGDTLTNTATVDYDTIPGDDQPEEREYEEEDSEEVLVLSPDLVVVKSVDDATLSPGDTTFYTLSISNVGAVNSNTATNVVVTDVLPLGLTYVNATGLPPGATASYDPDTRTVTVSGFAMEAGDSYDIVLNVSVDDPAPAGADFPGQADDETLTNTASITADNFEPTPEDNEDEEEVVLEADPDLTVTKVANVTTVTTGQQVTYTVTVQNLGNQVSTGVVVTDHLDISVVDFVSASNGGTFDPDTGEVTWTLDNLSPTDGPQVFTLVVQVKATVPAGPDTLDNTIDVVDDGQSGPESDDTNNDDDESIELDATPDLVLDKEVDTSKAIQGDRLNYTITVTNAGNQGSTGIVITDQLPKGLVFVSASDGGVYDPVTGTVVWSGLALEAGQSLQVTIEVRIPDLYQPGKATNGASVVDDGDNGPDPTPENNSDDAVTVIDSRYVYNALNGNIFGDDEDDDHFGRPWDWRPPLLPISPIYSGTADPGTQIRLVIYSDRGTELASQFVMADTGGNWLASFPGATIQDRPHEVRVIQDAGLGNANAGFLFNFRTYFSPAANPQQFFSEVGGVGGAGSFASSDLLDAMIQGFLNPVFQPNPSLYSYEFLPTSTTTAQYAN